MGYYDQGPSSENRERRRRGGGGIFFSGLIGVIVGALLVLVAVPQLTGTDLFGSNNNANGVTTENKVDSAKTENVAVDVSSDVTKAVEKAGDSVVGISNIQSQSFWVNPVMTDLKPRKRDQVQVSSTSVKGTRSSSSRTTTSLKGPISLKSPFQMGPK